MKKHFLTIALMALLLPGCMAARQETASFDALSERYVSDAEALAVSAAREISDRHTSYVPISVDAAPGAFGTALERELRNNGMTLVDSGGVRLSYKLNVTQQDGKPLGYAEISSSDGKLLCFTRNLGEMRYTAAPSNGGPSSSLESRSLPDPAVPTAEAGRLSSSPIIGGGTPVEPEKRDVAPREPTAVAESPAKTVTVTRSGTAATVARRYGVPVRDFCRWNNVGAGATLITGYQVYLSEPPAGTIPMAAENPVPAGVAAGTPEATLPAPVPASTTLPAHTSAKLSLPSAAPQKVEAKTISYTPVAAPVTPPAPPVPVAKGREGVSPVPSPMPTSTPSGDTASAVPASLPADAEIIPVSNPAGMGVRSWEIVKGEMLKAQLERWATDAGYTLIWSAHNDYEMQSNSTFTGPFKDAVKAFFGALQSNGHALRVTIFEGNNVMEVSEH